MGFSDDQVVAIEFGLKLRRAQHRPTPVIAYEAPDDATSARFTLRAREARLCPHDHAEGIPGGRLPARSSLT